MTDREKKQREILLGLVNECENCAQMGERIMCQSLPKEEARLKCVDQALSELNAIPTFDEEELEDLSKVLAKLKALSPKEVGVEEIRKAIEEHKWKMAKYVMENQTMDLGQSSEVLAKSLLTNYSIRRRDEDTKTNNKT